MKITDQQAVVLAQQLLRLEPSVEPSVRKTAEAPEAKSNGAAPKKMSDVQARAISNALEAETRQMRKNLGLDAAPSGSSMARLFAK